MSCLEEPRAESWTSCMQSIIIMIEKSNSSRVLFLSILGTKAGHWEWCCFESSWWFWLLCPEFCFEACDRLLFFQFFHVLAGCGKHMVQNWRAIVESALLLESKGRNVATVWPRLVHGCASLGLLHKHGWNFWSCVSCIYQDYYCYLCWNDLIDFYVVVCVCVYICVHALVSCWCIK